MLGCQAQIFASGRRLYPRNVHDEQSLFQDFRSFESLKQQNLIYLHIFAYLCNLQATCPSSISSFHLYAVHVSVRLTVVTQTNFVVNTNRSFDWIMGQLSEALPHGKGCEALSWPMERVFCF